MTLRQLSRSVALSLALLLCMIRLGRMRLRGPLSGVQRARWLQSACQGVLRSLGIVCRVKGTPPGQGLVVSNHLSYLDIAIYSAVMPCAFVSKAEVRNWPYFGFAARAGGTVFLDRGSHASAAAAASEVLKRLKLPVPVLLFPEGTSTDGSTVMQFHSGLFQPAIGAAAPVTAASVRYVIDGGIPESAVCWFGDAPFVSHLWSMLNAPPITAEVTFGEPVVYADRRAAGRTTHEQVVAMRMSKAGSFELEGSAPK